MQKAYKGDTIPGLIILLFGLSVAVYTLVEDSMRVNAQTSDGVPGAGFFPVLLGFVLAVLGGALFVRGLMQKGSVQYFQVDPEIRRNLRRLVLAVAGIVVFFILWQLTRQFVPCMAVLCFYLNFIFGRSVKYNIIYTAVLTAFIYLAFVVGFSIQFNM